MAKVLFVCLHNAGRSQMTQALFTLAAGGAHEARSAGTSPAQRVHPAVVAAMKEVGVDLNNNAPTMLSIELAQWADLVVTMGCGESCPVIPGKRYIDWELTDPKELPLEEVRELREEIRRRVRELVQSLD